MLNLYTALAIGTLALGFLGTSANARPTTPHSVMPTAKNYSPWLQTASHKKRCKRIRVCEGNSGTAGTTPQYCYYVCR